ERDASGRLTRRSALQHGTSVIEVVLGHAHEVRVPGARASQRGCACAGELRGVYRVGRHDGLPLGPFGVGDDERHRPALGASMTHAPRDRDPVLLEGHACSAAVAEATTSEGLADIGAAHFDARWEPLNDAYERRTMGFTSSQPPEHVVILPCTRERTWPRRPG